MADDKLKYRKLAFNIKRNYPLINISFDSKDDFLGRLIDPTKLFITKSKFGLSAIFTYRRYDNLSEFSHGFFKHNEHELVFESYINHDWREIEEFLRPYFNDFGFIKIIFKNVNSARLNYNENSNVDEDSDVENFGDDLIEVINKYLFQLHSYSILKRVYHLISSTDISAFGKDIFEIIKEISMHVGFVENFHASDNEKFHQALETFGDEIIEIIESRSEYFDFYIRKHFEEYIRDWYLSGDDRALANLT